MEPVDFFSRYRRLLLWTGGIVLLIFFLFAYLVSGGLYQVVPLPGCTVCAYKINKITGRSWYMVRDRQFEVRWRESAGRGYIYNPHSGKMEPE